MPANREEVEKRLKSEQNIKEREAVKENKHENQPISKENSKTGYDKKLKQQKQKMKKEEIRKLI